MNVSFLVMSVIIYLSLSKSVWVVKGIENQGKLKVVVFVLMGILMILKILSARNALLDVVYVLVWLNVKFV